MGTYAAYSLVAVVPTSVLLILRYAFVYALCRKATKERRPITIRSGPLALSVDYPVEPTQSRRVSKPVVAAAALPSSSAHETKLAS